MKDPAFLFYSNDFLSGTMLMSNEEVGIYIKLLCLQHQQEHLEEKDMLSIGATKKVFSKFIKDDKLIQNDINNLIKTIKNVGNRILNSNQKLIKHLVAGHVQ